MAYSFKSSDHFNTVLYTGNGSTQSVTGVNFQPDLVWGKSHTSGYSHQWYDALRGATYSLKSNGATTQETLSTGLTSFDSDGFSLGNNANINTSGHTVTAWNWKAGGTGSTNTDGSISATVSANTTAGFSIVKWDGTGSNGTIGHGLGKAPSFIILKSYTNDEQWVVGHDYTYLANGWNYYLHLQSTADRGENSNRWQNTAPTSSVFSVGTEDQVNSSSKSYVAYCFANTRGFSKFGYYHGASQLDGIFQYTGFAPSLVICKVTNTTGNWIMFDRKSSHANLIDNYFDANVTDGLGSNANGIDFLSNGFKHRNQFDTANNSYQYIYMAFAESPLVGTNDTPCTAR